MAWQLWFEDKRQVKAGLWSSSYGHVRLDFNSTTFESTTKYARWQVEEQRLKA
jgi:hypothetical protein